MYIVSPSVKPSIISTLYKSDTPTLTHDKYGPSLESLITINLLKFSPSTFSIKNFSISTLSIFKIAAAV